MLNKYIIVQSRGSSGGMATDYGLDGRGTIPGSGKVFLFSITVQTGSGAH
jgi:hypothetical protein